ncbi:hypothetical protein IFT84_06725 [Rhizobium sp. CFBP 8762]|uniref:hypothetical protein n=1 Tax=Rhizobium sp. CFBP 8762 TaxID=2775279 RepID=UPI00177B273A|nr:hypothetical protein [Rhizobium sp. CFBP 8762]MBD8554218.1 hypothetical protein [Rhizobium sp. CFBP 8762]
MPDTYVPRQKPKQQRGAPCTVEHFAAKYNLDADEAARLYARFGPSEMELDILMAAKGKTPQPQNHAR